MQRFILVLAVTLAAAALGVQHGCTAEERIAGKPKIIDGDSFEIGTTQVRLFGVDAPEGRQSCTRAERPWRCGDAAADKLRELVGSATISCVQRDVDDYGRIVAQCRRGSTDLAEEMARAGFALAYRRYSDAYVDEENEARAARRGIWASEFAKPEDWRRDAAPRTTAPASPAGQRAGCYIKGNINAAGEKIYHTPDSSAYRNTEIDERAGERWFCTEQEARSAGFRAPARRGGSR